MKPPAAAPIVSHSLVALALLYFAASLAHFAHNAEFIAFYPGLPSAITPETVYLAWMFITGFGALAIALFRFKLNALAWVALAVYGAFGLDGLLHYTMALCSEHTLWANVTIWSEASLGLLLFLASTVYFVRQLRR